MTERETLAQEFARLVVEYQAGGPSAEEAWNYIADFAVENSDTIFAALSRVGEQAPTSGNEQKGKGE